MTKVFVVIGMDEYPLAVFSTYDAAMVYIRRHIATPMRVVEFYVDANK